MPQMAPFSWLALYLFIWISVFLIISLCVSFNTSIPKSLMSYRVNNILFNW